MPRGGGSSRSFHGRMSVRAAQSADTTKEMASRAAVEALPNPKLQCTRSLWKTATEACFAWGRRRQRVPTGNRFFARPTKGLCQAKPDYVGPDSVVLQAAWPRSASIPRASSNLKALAATRKRSSSAGRFMGEQPATQEMQDMPSRRQGFPRWQSARFFHVAWAR